jgi:hypothetical protein
VRYRIVASVIVAGMFAVMGCSGERELPVVNQKGTVSFLDKGSLSNPLKVQKPAGKQLARRAGPSPRAGR